MLFQLALTKLNCFRVYCKLITWSSHAKSVLVELSAFNLKPQNLNALRRRLWSYYYCYLNQTLLQLLYIFFQFQLQIYKMFVVFCVFSHDFSFENASVIFLIDDQRKTVLTLQWLLDFDWLLTSRMNVWSSLFIVLFQLAKINFRLSNFTFYPAKCVTMPHKVIIKNAMSQTSICQWVLAKQSSKQCFSQVREIRKTAGFFSA